MADIIDFPDLNLKRKDALEDEVFECTCGSVHWLICKDETIECSECGAFMDIHEYIARARGPTH